MSYANVFEAKAINEGATPKYSVSLIIPKSDKKTVKAIKDAIEEAKVAGTAKFGGKIPANLKTPLRDGDEDRPDDEAYQDSYFINANSVTRPAVVDEDLHPIMDPSEFYSGCYGRASVNFYAYNANNTSKGIAAGLNNLQKLGEGDRLGGGSTAAEDFGSSDGDDLL